MKKRVLYGTAIVLLAISVALMVWLGSFNLGEYGPSDPQQTFLRLIRFASSRLEAGHLAGRQTRHGHPVPEQKPVGGDGRSLLTDHRAPQPFN